MCVCVCVCVCVCDLTTLRKGRFLGRGGGGGLPLVCNLLLVSQKLICLSLLLCCELCYENI